MCFKFGNFFQNLSFFVKLFLEYIDANDNGVSICDGPTRYSNKSDLANRVRRLNPSWSVDNPDENGAFRLDIDSF